MIIEVSNKEKLNNQVKNYKNKGYVEEKDRLIFKLLKKVNFTPNIINNEDNVKLVKESIFLQGLGFILGIFFVLFFFGSLMSSMIPFIIVFGVLLVIPYKILTSTGKKVEITTNKLNLNVNIGGKAIVEKVANKKELELVAEQYNTAGYKIEVLGIDYTRLSKKKFTWWLFIVLFLTLTIGAWIYLIYYAVKKKEIVIIKIDKNSVKSSIVSDSNVNDNNVVIIDKNELKSLIKDNTNNIDEKNELKNSIESNTNDNTVEYCTECGNPVSTGSKFCKSCGTKIE